MYFVYALTNQQHDRIYVGLTKNVKQRELQHNLGMTRATAFFRPWNVFYVQETKYLRDARRLEKRFKTGFGKEILKSIRDDLLRACSSTG